MKILVFNKEDNKIFKIYLPLFLLKSKFINKLIIKNVNNDNVSNLLVNIISYKNIKHYIKLNGHFNLIEIYSSAGDIIKIRI